MDNPTRLDPKSFADYYQRICRSYVQLADRYEQLDVEHMQLKSHLVRLLKSLKAHQQAMHQLRETNQLLHSSYEQEKQELTRDYEAKIQSLTDRLKQLEPLEALLSEEMQQQMAETEEQLALVEETNSEMDAEPDPDLTSDEKALLVSYFNNPENFDAPTLPRVGVAPEEAHDPVFSLHSSQPPLWEHLFDDPESVAHMKGF